MSIMMWCHKYTIVQVLVLYVGPSRELQLKQVKFAFSGKAKTVAYGGAGGLEGAGEPPKKRAKMSFQTVTSSFAELAQQATRQLEGTITISFLIIQKHVIVFENDGTPLLVGG